MATTKPTGSKPSGGPQTKIMAGQRSGSTLIHPRSVPILAPERDEDEEPDQPFVDGARDELDPALRYRMISERAYHRYVDRGYVDGGDLDDWLQAEADVDHMLLNEAARRGQGA